MVKFDYRPAAPIWRWVSQFFRDGLRQPVAPFLFSVVFPFLLLLHLLLLLLHHLLLLLLLLLLSSSGFVFIAFDCAPP